MKLRFIAAEALDIRSNLDTLELLRKPQKQFVADATSLTIWYPVF